MADVARLVEAALATLAAVTNASQRPADGVVDAAECARLIGTSLSTFEKLAAAQAWKQDDLPRPCFVASGSGTKDKHGNRKGQRRWRRSTIEEWLIRHEWQPKDPDAWEHEHGWRSA